MSTVIRGSSKFRFHVVIKKLFTMSRLSQEEFCKTLNITKSGYYRMSKGLKTPDYKVLCEILTVYKDKLTAEEIEVINYLMSMADNSEIKEFSEYYRKKYKISKTQLAKAIQINISTLSAYEKGIYYYSEDIKNRILKVVKFDKVDRSKYVSLVNQSQLSYVMEFDDDSLKFIFTLFMRDNGIDGTYLSKELNIAPETYYTMLDERMDVPNKSYKLFISKFSKFKRYKEVRKRIDKTRRKCKITVNSYNYELIGAMLNDEIDYDDFIKISKILNKSKGE